jgi:hypothetical protein
MADLPPRIAWIEDLAASLRVATWHRVTGQVLVRSDDNDAIRKTMLFVVADTTPGEVRSCRVIIKGWAEHNDCHVRSVQFDSTRSMLVCDLYMKRRRGPEMKKNPFAKIRRIS